MFDFMKNLMEKSECNKTRCMHNDGFGCCEIVKNASSNQVEVPCLHIESAPTSQSYRPSETHVTLHLED